MSIHFAHHGVICSLFIYRVIHSVIRTSVTFLFLEKAIVNFIGIIVNWIKSYV